MAQSRRDITFGNLGSGFQIENRLICDQFLCLLASWRSGQSYSHHFPSHPLQNSVVVPHRNPESSTAPRLRPHHDNLFTSAPAPINQKSKYKHRHHIPSNSRNIIQRSGDLKITIRKLIKLPRYQYPFTKRTKEAKMCKAATCATCSTSLLPILQGWNCSSMADGRLTASR
jgi:hypothetical protein